VRSLFLHDKIVTTETRAKEVRPIAEKLITTAKRNDIQAKRLVRRFIDSNIPKFGYTSAKNAQGKTVQKPALNPDYVIPRLFDVIAPRYAARSGGYTRLTRIGSRRGDGAPMVLLELVDHETIETTPTAAAPVTTRRRGLFRRGE
jgi:large subunit ribosomal protein L17